MSSLRLEGVGLKTPVGTHYLLQDISFEVTKGERVVILGASGAGKTSLLRLLNRLISPSSGILYFENQDYRQIPVIALRQQITLVLQESKLLEMPVRQALTYPLHLRRLPATLIEQRLEEWVHRLNLPTEWLERTEVQLSTGQRQWVAIARAIMTQPKVLLLDEPTSALDAGKASHLLQVLRQLAETQMTIVMVNHQLDLAQQFATRVLHLQRGVLLQESAADQVHWEELKQYLIAEEKQDALLWDSNG